MEILAEEYEGGMVSPGYVDTTDNEVFDSEDPIANELIGEARRMYIRRLTLRTRKDLASGLKKTLRWQNNGFLMDPDWQENNLDHVVELIAWANEIEANYLDLWEEVSEGLVINWRKLLAMLIQHDIGEIEVGDLSRSHPDFHLKKGRDHKRKERYAAYLMLGKNLPKRKVAEGRELYQRFDRRVPEDKLVMLGHVLDKGQAAQQIPYHVLPFNVSNPAYNVSSKLISTQSDVLDYAEKLMVGLKNDRAKDQLREFLLKKVVGHFDRLDLPGVEAWQREVREKFPAVFEL